MLGIPTSLALALTLVAAPRPQSTDEAGQRALLARHHPVDADATDARMLALGRKLYFDARLSADGMLSCASCHDVGLGLADGRPLAVGIGGRPALRNSPTTANVGLLSVLSHDGAARSLEEQATRPILDAREMGHRSADEAVAAISYDPVYQRMFREAFDTAPDFDGIGRALARFQRSLVYTDTPFDRWRQGEPDALSASARRGHTLFTGRANCVACHEISGATPRFSDEGFHDTGVAPRRDSAAADLGRYRVTGRSEDLRAFRTAPLRNVGVTAPYMHDGSLRTLGEVVDHYAEGGRAHAVLAPELRPQGLSADDREDLVQFLLSLTDRRFAAQQRSEIERQRKLDARRRASLVD